MKPARKRHLGQATTIMLKGSQQRRITTMQRIYPLGISNFDGEQTFAVSEDDTRSNFPSKMVTGKSIVCNVRRYSTILDMLGLATIDVLKLDVGGQSTTSFQRCLDLRSYRDRFSSSFTIGGTALRWSKPTGQWKR